MQGQIQSPIKSKAVNSGEAQHLRSLDKSIRKKWNQLRYFRRSKAQRPRGQEGIEGRKLQTEPAQKQAEFKISPHVIEIFRSNRKREVVMDRNKKNEDIFYRKKPPAETPTKKVTQSLSLGKKYFSEKPTQRCGLERVPSKEVRLPLMLQKRTRKLEKEFQIIENSSSKSLKAIETREFRRHQLIEEQKEKLIESLKGSNIYYKFIQRWTMPSYEDN